MEQTFYITYEELKQDLYNSICIDLPKLFILPMRNWNRRADLLSGCAAKLFILPMRNWNF